MNEFLQLIFGGIAAGSIYALIAIGFTLIFKATRIFNFAAGNFVTIAAFICWTAAVEWHLPMLISVILGMIGGALVGFLSYFLAIRPMIGQPVLSTIAMTLGLSILLGGVTVLVWGGVSRVYPPFMPNDTIRLGAIVIAEDVIITFLMAMLMLGVFFYLFQKTNVGLAMRVAAEEHQVAQAAGVRVKRVFAVIWTISGLVCAVGGILLGNITQVDLSLQEYGFKVIPAVILGGLESIPGAVVGGLAIGILEKLATGYINPFVGGGIQTVFAYVIMIIVMIFRPYGLFGLKTIERI